MTAGIAPRSTREPAPHRPPSPSALAIALIGLAAMAVVAISTPAPEPGGEWLAPVAATASALAYTDRPLAAGPGDLEAVIRRNGYGHCGHSAYLLAQELERLGRRASLRKITLANGVIHVLVDLLDAEGRPERCLDGQLGLVYDAPVAALFADPARAERARSTGPIAPRFAAYHGREFFAPKVAAIASYSAEEYGAELARALTR